MKWSEFLFLLSVFKFEKLFVEKKMFLVICVINQKLIQYIKSRAKSDFLSISIENRPVYRWVVATIAWAPKIYDKTVLLVLVLILNIFSAKVSVFFKLSETKKKWIIWGKSVERSLATRKKYRTKNKIEKFFLDKLKLVFLGRN